MTRTVTLAGLEVTLEAGHRAWACYEKMTGRSVLLATHLRELFRGGLSQTYEWGWALSTKWRSAHAPTMLYDAWLDLFPAVGTPEWSEVHTAVSDLVVLPFYDKTWAELVQMLNEAGEQAEAEANRVVTDG